MNPFEENEQNDITEIKLIEIWVEVNGRKKNTYVAGWNISEPDLKEHIKIIKKKNGCNGTLKEITVDGNKSYTIKVIQLQGEHVDYIKSYLVEQNIDINLIRIRG